MNKQYLTFEQAICAARIFLNTFGFIIENNNDINEASKIKIFDESMNETGVLFFDNNKVRIITEYKNGRLEAYYDIDTLNIYMDYEDNSLSSNWCNNIYFNIVCDNNLKLSGEFSILGSNDSEFGYKCNCNSKMILNKHDSTKMTLSIFQKFDMFNLNIASDDYEETIRVAPYNNLTGNNTIIHDIKIKKGNSYSYRKYTSVCIYNSNDDLHIFKREEENGNTLDEMGDLIPRVESNNDEDIRIQAGLLMQDLDYGMIEKINELREILTIDGISLFDNLISVCYDNYTNQELNALLGVKRLKMNYQDGSDNLRDSYFGINNNTFPLLETQKQLIKN